MAESTYSLPPYFVSKIHFLDKIPILNTVIYLISVLFDLYGIQNNLSNNVSIFFV